MNVKFKFLRILLFFVFYAALSANGQDNLSALKNFLIQEKVDISDNNSIVFFDNGKDKFKDLLKAISQAKSSIHMEYFNFRDDSIANLLFDSLTQKVKQGVEVRLIYDDFGNASNDQPIKSKKLKEIRAAGIQMYRFDPIKFPWVNHIIPRDHRKIVVIDGKSAYSGGMNVADYYLNGKKEFGGWHDVHYRIEGDAVEEYQKIFLRMWKLITHEEICGAQYYPGESLPRNALTCLKTDTTFTKGHKTIAIINREPHTSPKIIRETFVQAIDAARKVILIINPYFTLNAPIRKALQRAVKRGVSVQIMVSEKSDIPITPRIVDYKARQMQKSGAEVYYYTGGFHHSKIMMIDHQFCYAGSANLDSRSLRCDYEINALIFDEESTRELEHIFYRDKSTKCFQLTDEFWKERSKWKNFLSWFYHFLAPFV